MVPEDGPPAQIALSLDEALDLLVDLEDTRDALSDSSHLTVVVAVESQSDCSAVDSALPTRTVATMPTELLTASEAARRLGIPTRALVRLISERQIRYVMVDGIAHIPEEALDDYQAKAS
jgi:excisionase family DNA binding protein